VLGALLPRLPRGAAAVIRGRRAVVTLSVAYAGCVNPQADYNDFVARAPAPDAQVTGGDAQATDPCPQILGGTPSGTFYGACMTTASSGDVTQATYVKLDTTVVASADHKTGQLTVAITSLQRTPAGGPPTNVSQTVGATTNPPAAAVSKECTYVIEAGTTVIPAASNAAKMDLTLTGTRYRGKLLTQDESCTALDATITTPVTVDLTKGGNNCIFRRAPKEGTITPFKLAEFACPGAPAM
jgi:hypothetical protein